MRRRFSRAPRLPRRPRVAQKRLIAIFQRGAVDGLNVVVPFGESDYYRVRPTIAIARPGDGDDARARSRRLLRFQPAAGAAQAAVGSARSRRRARVRIARRDALALRRAGLHGVGNAGREEHRRRVAESLSAGEARRDRARPFRAVALTPQLPRMLQGSAPALAMSQHRAVRHSRGASATRRRSRRSITAAADRVLNGTGREAFDAMKTLKVADPARYAPATAPNIRAAPFGAGAASRSRSSPKPTSASKWHLPRSADGITHVNQGQHRASSRARLDDFSRSIAALVTDLGDRMADTVVLTMSEFGRAVSENGNRGTDHGHGNAMLVMGGGVSGGQVYGRWPGLAADQRYEGRDLAVTTDFRDVFGEIVVRHMGVADPKSIFPGYSVQPSKFPGLFA